MADAPIITEKDIYEQLGNGLLALVGVTTSTPSASPSLGAVALAGPTVALVFARGWNRFAKRRLPRFATEFLGAFDPEPEEAAKKVNATAEEESFTESLDDIMMRSFRLMMDAVDETVVPILGYMAGRYAFERKKPDALFRGLGRLLCELEPGELEQLLKLLRLTLRASSDGPQVNLTVATSGQLVAYAGGRSIHEKDQMPDARRLIMLVKREGLSYDLSEEGFADSTGEAAHPDRWLGMDSITTNNIIAVVELSRGSTPPAAAT